MKHLLLILCTFMAAAVFADSDSSKTLEKLQQKRVQTQKLLIDLRIKEIKENPRLKRLAEQILELNKELTEHLNMRPEIRKANQELKNIDEEIQKEKQKLEEQKKETKQ